MVKSDLYKCNNGNEQFYNCILFIVSFIYYTDNKLVHSRD